MIVIDSSGWLEYLKNGPVAHLYTPLFISHRETVLTPSIVIFEVLKNVRRKHSYADSLHAMAGMQRTKVVSLTADLATEAVALSIEHRLAMADSIVLATARFYSAELFTSDADFAGIPGVTYWPK